MEDKKSLIAGVDEVGRGSLIGPVYAAAVILNDSIKKAKIRYYATRNEATAPIMAASYGRIKKDIGVACVTAGPGATNAIPGLAEAFVDSSPIVVISGQVEKKHTTISTKSKTIRTFGTAEINIEPIVKNLTKYSKTNIYKSKNRKHVGKHVETF